MKKHLDITVFGRVQGVFFRQLAAEEACARNITGYADRLENGNIQIEAEGEEADLKSFCAWCQKGPILAKVEMVAYEYSSKLKNFNNFEIRKSQSKVVSGRIRYMALG